MSHDIAGAHDEGNVPPAYRGQDYAVQAQTPLQQQQHVQCMLRMDKPVNLEREEYTKWSVFGLGVKQREHCIIIPDINIWAAATAPKVFRMASLGACRAIHLVKLFPARLRPIALDSWIAWG